MRVFVLGAGASVHAGYPVTKDLGPKLVKWAAENTPPLSYLYRIDAEELQEYGPLDDIEEIVTRLEGSERTGPILAGLREALCRFFDSIRPAKAELYRQLADAVVRAGDVIISFNYDLSLERELKRAGKWEVSDGYGFDLGVSALPRSPVPLLKLHGSTNWMDLLFEGLRGGQTQCGGPDSFGARPVIPPWEFGPLGYSGIEDPKFKQGGMDRSGSMVLPSRRKKYYIKTSINPREREDFWTMLWSQAANALWDADEITIIGYSLPTADARARNLLLQRSNPGALLTVCCGRQTAGIGEEFVSAGFRRGRVRTAFARFEEFLNREGVSQIWSSSRQPLGRPEWKAGSSLRSE